MNDESKIRASIGEELVKINTRLKALEDEVFRPPGNGGIGERLSKIMKKIDEINASFDEKIQIIDSKYAKKIKETIRVTAELGKEVENLYKIVSGKSTRTTS